VVSVVLEHVRRAGVQGLGYADRLPSGAAWGSTEVRADRAFLALPKYVGFFEAFLKYEPAAATDMSADNPPSKRGSSSPCDSNGL
jgi:hypothetical protein